MRYIFRRIHFPSLFWHQHMPCWSLMISACLLWECLFGVFLWEGWTMCLYIHLVVWMWKTWLEACGCKRIMLWMETCLFWGMELCLHAKHFLITFCNNSNEQDLSCLFLSFNIASWLYLSFQSSFDYRDKIVSPFTPLYFLAW